MVIGSSRLVVVVAPFLRVLTRKSYSITHEEGSSYGRIEDADKFLRLKSLSVAGFPALKIAWHYSPHRRQSGKVIVAPLAGRQKAKIGGCLLLIPFINRV